MRALVTGASGFVGSALCRRLAHEGHEVVALMRTATRTARAGHAEVVEGSIAEPAQIARAAEGCDVIFHAAGIAAIDAPERVLRWVHVAGSENVLRAARHARVERVVHISCADASLTSEDRMHWDEKRSLPTLPVGPHARTKLVAEELMLAQSDDTLEVTALRPALLWGPDDVDGISRLTRDVCSGAFTLYDGGRNIIASTHIDNLCNAALLAATADDAPGRAYYVTDGEFLEAREFYTRLFSALGLAPLKLTGSRTAALLLARVRSVFSRAHQARVAQILRAARSSLFDVSRAVADLGYEPKIDLDARMRELSEWVQSAGGLDAILLRTRPAPTSADVDAQVRAAGGD
ncbi:MAG TPA: NAD-dependent epimerase/dehydratase family protein [Polyangiales bacterium]|nr:NAD-dependent epimerase/dehydratase family protein [Polyangiales bacterium]